MEYKGLLNINFSIHFIILFAKVTFTSRISYKMLKNLGIVVIALSCMNVWAQSASVEEVDCSLNTLSFTGLVPNPVDCHSFYICDNGRPALIPCPSGLCFNSNGEDGGACDHCDLVPGCEEIPPTVSSPEPTSAPPEISTTGNPGTSGLPSSGQPSSEVPSSTGNPGTSGAPSSTQPPEASSTQPASSTGQPSSTANPTSTAPPASSSAPSSTTEGPGDEVDLHCPAHVPYVYLSYPGNCNRFYYCVNGKNIGSWNCAEGLWFKYGEQACTYPWGSSCQ